MIPAQIAQKLQQQFGPAITAAVPNDKHPRVHTSPEHWHALAQFLRDDADLSFDWLSCITALDYVAQDQLCAAYDFYSTSHRHHFAVKVYCDRKNPVIPSVADLWSAADWHEREAFDLMGITFSGHPDLRRILLPEDWEIGRAHV